MRAGGGGGGGWGGGGGGGGGGGSSPGKPCLHLISVIPDPKFDRA